MNILRITMKELKQNVRDFKSNLLMILFPVVLIIILGTAFSGVMNNTLEMNDIEVVYLSQNPDSPLSMAFETLTEELSADIGISFDKTTIAEEGFKRIADNTCAAFVEIADNPVAINLYKNDRHAFNGTLVETILNSFLDTYSTMHVIAENNPKSLTNPLIPNTNNYVLIHSLDRNRQPGSLDYYAVTILTMILLYSAQTGLWGIRSEVEGKTGPRILCAPVKRHELLTGIIMGSILVTFIQGFIVLLFSRLILKAYWGEHLPIVLLVILTYSIMAVSIGAALAMIFRKSEAGSGIINIIIPIFVFLGGGYVPLDFMNGMIKKMSVVSPVRWVNQGLFQVIYEGRFSGAFISMGMNITISILFIAVGAIISGRGKKVYA